MSIEQAAVLEQWSGTSLTIAFVLYNLAFFVFVLSLIGKRWSNRDPQAHQRKWGMLGLAVSGAGFVCHSLFFSLRWIAAGHIPVSNLYEFMTFLGMCIVGAFIVVYLIYRAPLLGAFAMPVAVIILAYAAVFPKEIQPLIPQLDSVWLYIHVTLAALGEAFFAVGFAAGLMYLLRTVDFKDNTKRGRRKIRWLEFTFVSLLALVSFILLTFAFRGMGYDAQFVQAVTESDEFGQTYTVENVYEYTLPPLIKPHSSEMVEMEPFLGLKQPLAEAPAWLLGYKAGQKLNTIVWSIIGGLLLYVFLRLVFRRPISAMFGRAMQGISAEDLDEISYRAITIGYPIFALGGLVFAMIWAHEAWGRFWAFDPKETWALITWLFYTAYLHLRLSRGWQGSKSAWLAVLGFLVVLFTLLGVNLLIAGLHSYAGV